MFASSYTHTVQPTTPMQFPAMFGHPAPVIKDSSYCDSSYRVPSPVYDAYRPGAYSPPALDDQPKMPSISVPPTVNLNLLSPPSPIVAPVVTPQTFASIPSTMPTQSVKKEMHMAIAGTDSALAGIDTPIARHVAQLVAWLWFAPRTQHLSPTAMSAAAELANSQPFNALSVRVSDGFSNFVSHILHLTKVSHSVVLLSLLYVRRMSKIYPPPPPESEKVTFIIGLMLANKFLDDNTYTNRTWSDLSKIPVETLNTVEHDALAMLRWDLTVNQTEFRTWSQLLDQLIFTHRTSYQRPYHSPSALSPYGAPQTPFTFQHPRARTQSPPEHQTHWMPTAGQIPSPPRQRKRSACDAFSMEAAMAQQHAKSMRIPERRGYVDLPGAPAFNGDRASSGTASTLNRAASMNRSGLRPLSTTPRRGSVPGLAPSPLADMAMCGVQHRNSPVDNRHTTSTASGQGQYQLSAPPPHSMVFYTCAADSHIGQDGHRRKATLHYQAPPSFYPEQHGQGYNVTDYQISPTAGSTLHLDPVSHLAPIPGQYGGSYNIGPPGIPAPADFANAGPPGYQYEQEMQYQQSHPTYADSQYYPSYQTYAPSQPGPIAYGQRRSVGSSDLAQYHHGALPQTRSEWSSPMPGYPSYW